MGDKVKLTNLSCSDIIPSSLTDLEWEILEPLFGDITAEAADNTKLDETRHHRWHLLSTENGCNWEDFERPAALLNSLLALHSVARS